MVRRTRACQACRSRRMRCDETLPQCDQCLRAGRQCPGPISGAIIVDVTTQTVIRARSKLINSFHRPQTQNPPAQLISPSQSPIIIQNFLSRFLDYFASRSSSSPGRFWLHELPSLSTSGTRNGLELAVQATSTAFCASATSNLSYYAGSRKIYGEALQKHSRSIAALRNSGSQVRAIAAAQLLCTTLLLCFYEAISSTQSGGEGYMRHVEGAAKMVEVLGPEGCADGLVNELFFTARRQMLLISFLTKKPSIYATPQYLSIPSHGGIKPVHERLMDILTLLIEELNFPSDNRLEHPTRGPIFLTNVKKDLQGLWIEFQTCYYPGSLSEPGTEEATATSTSTSTSTDSSVDYPNAFTAYIESYFLFSRILCRVIGNRDVSPFLDIQEDEMIHHASASILSCAAYLETQNLGCGFISAVLPLHAVGIYGSVEDRKAARVVLETWRDRGVVRGLVGLVLVRLDSECGENSSLWAEPN
ncbi:hypothetical protein ONS96_011791 [Cadophora gregata f. sp. sojae]|nr:hypothetical protein ONS96_011791 [Cadophora gregata f. sp. sojae]